MLPDKPERWPRCFAESLSTGNVERILSLYDPDARFISASGAVLEGRDAIRDVLAQLVRANTRLSPEVIKVVLSGEIAMVYTDWRTSSSGHVQRAIEVLRRHSDGTWRLLFGDPSGRG
jgi:uncharacterized protein (TIGR02246 family)